MWAEEKVLPVSNMITNLLFFVKSKFEGKKKRKLLSLEIPSPRSEDMKNG